MRIVHAAIFAIVLLWLLVVISLWARGEPATWGVWVMAIASGSLVAGHSLYRTVKG